MCAGIEPMITLFHWDMPLWMAKLGGFLGRKGDGNPGWITIWRGWEKLSNLVRGISLARRLKIQI